MNYRTLSEWQQLAQQDPALWHADIKEALSKCIDLTNTSVVSRDLSSVAMQGSGPLAGVPYVAKDLFDVAGYPSHSSSVLPVVTEAKAEMNSAVVARMQNLGASCVAKTQMNEFAYGLSGENIHYGNCPHPKLEGCLTGGSSSGSAHMVAAGYVPIGLGTDTGGSIRLPAAWCGLYGLRTVPGYSMEGCFPLAASLDTVGWFTRTAEDMSTMIEAWFGLTETSEPLKGSALIPEGLVDADVFTRLNTVCAGLGLGLATSAEGLEASMPDSNEAFNILQSGEAYAIHEEWLGLYGELYDPSVKARILRGKQWSEEEKVWAKQMRAEVSAWFEAYFRSYDFLVLPVCPRASVNPDAATPDLREKTLRLTAPASLAQKPALTVPITLEGDRTVGLQFIFNELNGSVPLRMLKLCENI